MYDKYDVRRVCEICGEHKTANVNHSKCSELKREFDVNRPRRRAPKKVLDLKAIRFLGDMLKDR